MNKNPFVPTPSYAPQQPPLPPGPPPPQPGQPDYSAYWAAAAAAQQQPTGAAYAQQWQAQQASRPSAEQSALYANYGYGNNWQRQQQQQHQQHQQQPQQQQFHPPPPTVHAPPPPQPPPAQYNPYQPQAPAFQQPYVPQPHQPPMAQPAYTQPPPRPQGQPPMFVQNMPPMQQMQQQQGQQRQMHASPQHPPAKRQRFDGPSHGSSQGQSLGRNQSHGQLQPQGSGGFSGGGRGGMGGGRGGGGGGNRGGSNQGNRGGGRGGSSGGGRGGGLSNRGGGRGGSFNAGSSRGGGGGGGGGNALRAHGSRGNFGGGGNKNFHHSWGGGSFTSPSNNYSNQGGGSNYRNRTGFQNQNRGGGGRHDSSHSHGSHAFGNRESTMSSNFSQIGGKKEENRRTLTDFKIIGLEIRDLGWTWGTIPSQEGSQKENVPEQAGSQAESSAVGQGGSSAQSHGADGHDAPSRLRLYFHTPATADDSNPISTAMPSESRKGKRKKLEDDDGEEEELRAPPPPPQAHSHLHANDEGRESGSLAPSVAETTSEGDWLMAAIAEDDAYEHDDQATEAGASQYAHAENVDEEHDGEGENENDHYEHEGDVNMHAEEHDDMPAENTIAEYTVPPDGIPGLGHPEDHIASAAAESQNHAAPNSHDDHGLGDVSQSHPAEGANAASAPATNGISQNNESSVAPVEEKPADNVGQLDTQVSSVNEGGYSTESQSQSQSQQLPPSSAGPSQSPSQPRPLSVQPTLADIISQEPGASAPDSNDTTLVNGTGDESMADTQPSEFDQSQPEHLPEPPASASSASPYADAAAKKTKVPSANRLSISYAGSAKRLVINAEVVNSMKIHRSDGRIEIEVNLTAEEADGLKGIMVEALSDASKTYVPIEAPAEASSTDATVPPFFKATFPAVVTVIAYLNTARPLSEPKWVKTGDIQDWLRSIFGRMFWVAGDAAVGWEKKITVVDPDPPPTIWTVMETWANSAPGSTQVTERQRFLKTHMTESENVLEILLRLARGDRATPFTSGATLSASSVTGPLLSALSPSSPHAGQQTHVSLAVLAIYKMTADYATKAVGEKGKTEVDEHVGEIIRCIPSHLVYKSLDGIFKEWRVEKKGR